MNGTSCAMSTFGPEVAATNPDINQEDTEMDSCYDVTANQVTVTNYTFTPNLLIKCDNDNGSSSGVTVSQCFGWQNGASSYNCDTACGGTGCVVPDQGSVSRFSG